MRQDVDSRMLTWLKNDVITKYFQFHFRRVSQMQISPPWCCCHYHNSSSYQTLIRGTISLSEIFNSRFFVFVRNKGKGATTFKTSAGFYLVTEQWKHLTLAHSPSCHSQPIIQTLVVTFQDQGQCSICLFTCTVSPDEEIY